VRIIEFRDGNFANITFLGRHVRAMRLKQAKFKFSTNGFIKFANLTNSSH